MTTIEIKQGIAEDGFDKSDLINICLDLCHQIECKANAVNAHDELVEALQESIKSLKWCKMVYGGDWSQSANIVEIIDDAEKTLNKVKS